MQKLILGTHMSVRRKLKRIRNNWLDWAKDKAAPAELGFACQTIRQTVLAGSKANLRIGGASVYCLSLKPQALSYLCKSCIVHGAIGRTY